MVKPLNRKMLHLSPWRMSILCCMRIISFLKPKRTEGERQSKSSQVLTPTQVRAQSIGECFPFYYTFKN